MQDTRDSKAVAIHAEIGRTATSYGGHAVHADDAFRSVFADWVLNRPPLRMQTLEMSGNCEAGGDSDDGRVTALLKRARNGDAPAESELYDLVYRELRRRAQRAMKHQPRGHTLQPTALVHEVFLKIARKDVPWADRAHFFATAACAMKQVLVDHAKGKGRAKRHGGGDRVPIEDLVVTCEDRSYDCVALRDALADLAAIDPRAAEVVVMRFLSGMTVAEIAATLDVNAKTVERDWEFARTWLAERLGT